MHEEFSSRNIQLLIICGDTGRLKNSFTKEIYKISFFLTCISSQSKKVDKRCRRVANS